MSFSSTLVLILLTSVISATYLYELYYFYAPFATMEAINPAIVNITRDKLWSTCHLPHLNRQSLRINHQHKVNKTMKTIPFRWVVHKVIQTTHLSLKVLCQHIKIASHPSLRDIHVQQDVDISVGLRIEICKLLEWILTYDLRGDFFFFSFVILICSDSGCYFVIYKNYTDNTSIE